MGARSSDDLQHDPTFQRWKLAGGVLSVVALVAMLVTSLHRAPNPFWSWVLLVTAALLTVAIVVGVRRRRRRDRYRSRPPR